MGECTKLNTVYAIKSLTFFVKASNFSNCMMSVQVKDCSCKERNKSLCNSEFTFYVQSTTNYSYKTLSILIFEGTKLHKNERQELGDFEEMNKSDLGTKGRSPSFLTSPRE